jgi:hypothetical protein
VKGRVLIKEGAVYPFTVCKTLILMLVVCSSDTLLRTSPQAPHSRGLRGDEGVLQEGVVAQEVLLTLLGGGLGRLGRWRRRWSRLRWRFHSGPPPLLLLRLLLRQPYGRFPLRSPEVAPLDALALGLAGVAGGAEGLRVGLPTVGPAGPKWDAVVNFKGRRKGAGTVRAAPLLTCGYDLLLSYSPRALLAAGGASAGRPHPHQRSARQHSWNPTLLRLN